MEKMDIIQTELNHLKNEEKELMKKIMDLEKILLEEKKRKINISLASINFDNLYDIKELAKDLGESETIIKHLLETNEDMFITLAYHAWKRNNANYMEQLNAAGIMDIEGTDIANELNKIFEFAKENNDPTEKEDFYQRWQETRTRIMQRIPQLFKYMNIEAQRMNNETSWAGALLWYVYKIKKDSNIFIKLEEKKENEKENEIIDAIKEIQIEEKPKQKIEENLKLPEKKKGLIEKVAGTIFGEESEKQ